MGYTEYGALMSIRDPNEALTIALLPLFEEQKQLNLLDED